MKNQFLRISFWKYNFEKTFLLKDKTSQQGKITRPDL
jgi:hypothetical protein